MACQGSVPRRLTFPSSSSSSLRVVACPDWDGQTTNQVRQLSTSPSVLGLPELPPELFVREDVAYPAREIAMPRMPVENCRVDMLEGFHEVGEAPGAADLAGVGCAKDESPVWTHLCVRIFRQVPNVSHFASRGREGDQYRSIREARVYKDELPDGKVRKG